MSKSNFLNSVKIKKENRNYFDLTHDVKTSLKMGDLVPVCAMECIPGDKFNIGNESLLRFAPMIAPVMHRMDVSVHYFFVPNRIIWPGWEDFIKEITDIPSFPTITMNGGANTSKLADYFGISRNGLSVEQNEIVSALPFAAYQMIYNEFYRAQFLENDIPFELINGDNSANTELTKLRKRAWQHDYFTSALPSPQLGGAVDIPLGNVQQDAPIYYNNNNPTTLDGTPDDITLSAVPSATAPTDLYAQVDASVDATTINDLRRAYKLQEWLEKALRGGKRYAETLLVHFGVKPQDSRLQRPEYITGTKSPVIISEVLNTTGTASNPQGEMAGHGVSVTSGQSGSYYCQEHGFIIGVMSVLPQTAYTYQVPKFFYKTTDKFQYFWPEFANIGEQEVQRREIMPFQTGGSETFGYLPRYAEYRYQNNFVTGDFRQSLDFWHLGRSFATLPVLNADFVKCDPDTRIFAVEDGTDYLYAHVLNKISATRILPKFGTPTM